MGLHRERVQAELMGMGFKSLESIHDVKCWGLVKMMGLDRERIQAELTRVFF